MEFPQIDVHFQGFFEPKPFRYDDGIHHLFTDVDFAAMNLKECMSFLEGYTKEKCVKMYYELPEFQFHDGLRPIANELDYQEFIVVAYECGCQVPLYIDHFGRDIDGMIADAVKEQAELPETHSIGSSFDEEIAGLSDFEDNMASRKMSKEKGPKENPNSDKGDEEQEPDFVYRDEDEAATLQTFYTDEIDWKLQHPVLGMRFENPKALKHMLCNYAVANGYQLFYEKNDSKRLLVRCCQGDCTFRLWASWMGDELSFQIKSLEDEHNCARDFKLCPILNYRWIGAHYKQEFLHKEKITTRVLMEDVREKFGLSVSMGQCRRAKQYALSLVEGTIVEHYARLWSYAAEIRRSNPGSNVKMEVNSMPDGNNYFSRFYVCFDGLKRGWREGCRKVLNLDGCFLKGFCSGQLLAAVGRDGNNHIYPVAWAVVSVENKENWKWFLENVIDDLNLHTGWGLTLISDQHKGLLEVVKDVLPLAEHRQCARHILANFQKKYRGAQFEKIFWRACKSTTESHFDAVMKELHTLNPEAHKHLMDRDPKTWSRAFFRTGMACDAFENGMSESFNSVIVSARHKPIITMLEEIRVWMMERVYNMSIKGQSWKNKICPAIKDILDELKKEQRFWQVLPCGGNKFETRNTGASYAVDLDKKECTCRMWQLNGYGCVHSVATLSFLNTTMEPYVDPLLLGNTFIHTYQHAMLPMNGSDMWPTTEYIPPLPPMKRRMPGRPQVKRRRGEEEGRSGKKVSRAGKRVLCGKCRQPGHNKSTCTYIPTRPAKVNVKRKVHSEQGECSGVNKDVEDGGDKNKQKEQGESSGTKRSGNKLPTRATKKQKNQMHAQAVDELQQQAEAMQIVAALHGVPLQPPPQPQPVAVVPQQPQPQPQPVGVMPQQPQPQPQPADQPHLKQKQVKRSARIGMKKLATKVFGKNGEGSSGAKPMVID